MEPLGLFFSSHGRIAPRSFAAALVFVYLLGFASQALMSGPVIARSGILPFALAQAALTWAWYALHAKRLRDANRGTGGAAGVALLYAMAIVLLLLIVSFFTTLATPDATGEGVPPSSILGFFAVLYILVPLFMGADLGFFSTVIVCVALIAFAPVLIALAFSIVTGTRPTVPAMLPARS